MTRRGKTETTKGEKEHDVGRKSGGRNGETAWVKLGIHENATNKFVFIIELYLG